MQKLGNHTGEPRPGFAIAGHLQLGARLLFSLCLCDSVVGRSWQSQ